LTSSNPGMFCAGADLKERKDMSPEEVHTFKRKMINTFINFENIGCPTIAVIDGFALGGGCELSLCSDLRICTEST
jgi:methylglutaconyl-CoA hydratase